MIATFNSIAEVRAGDLMRLEVVAVSQTMTLREAAERMSEAHVSGAPVVDSEGRCVGVLSASDFMRYIVSNPADVEVPEPFVCAWQFDEATTRGSEMVMNRMSKRLVMCHAEAPIRDVARMMQDARVHRVVIVNDDRRPIGVVTSMDILGVVADVC